MNVCKIIQEQANICSAFNESKARATKNPLFEHCLTRRRLLMCAAGLLGATLIGAGRAHATQYATSDIRNVYSKPNITQLSDKSNLFHPGDRPRSTIISTCVNVNTSEYGQQSSSYWGTDQGFGYENADQKDWPLRNHSYTLDVFDRSSFYSNAYNIEYLNDTLTGNALDHNPNESLRVGYRCYHIVSYAEWNISGFGGGIIPTAADCWSLHNGDDSFRWGYYGQYRCTENPRGEHPPDENCCFAGAKTRAYITCFSVTPEAEGNNYRLYYCMYVFIDMHAISNTHDDYAGFVWCDTLAAALGCHVGISGFTELAVQLVRNLYRCINFSEAPNSVVSMIKNHMSNAESNICTACSCYLSPLSYKKCFETSENAAYVLHYAFTGEAPSDSFVKKWAKKIELNGLASTSKEMLENLFNSTLTYPLKKPAFICTITEKDCVGNSQRFKCDNSCSGSTGKVFNKGTYTGTLSGITYGWSVKSTKEKVTIEANDSGNTKFFQFEATCNGAKDVKALLKVTYYHDYVNFTKAGLNPYCVSDRTVYGEVYNPLSASEAKAIQKDANWTGWCTDPECTKPYTPAALTQNLNLYCKNSFPVVWTLSNRAKQLERDIGRKFSTVEDMSVSTKLSALLPDGDVIDWKGVYPIPELSGVWWESGHDIRHSVGRVCKDATSKQTAKGKITINGKTTLYADWKPQTYDGIESG